MKGINLHTGVSQPVGAEIGLTRERVRQIEAQTLRKLGSLRITKGLRAFLE